MSDGIKGAGEGVREMALLVFSFTRGGRVWGKEETGAFKGLLGERETPGGVGGFKIRVFGKRGTRGRGTENFFQRFKGFSKDSKGEKREIPGAFSIDLGLKGKRRPDLGKGKKGGRRLGQGVSPGGKRRPPGI